jgi:hypothetical protein
MNYTFYHEIINIINMTKIMAKVFKELIKSFMNNLCFVFS